VLRGLCIVWVVCGYLCLGAIRLVLRGSVLFVQFDRLLVVCSWTNEVFSGGCLEGLILLVLFVCLPGVLFLLR
jgi:hypothetical protein